MSTSVPVTVIGAGAWGIAIAQLLARKGHEVTLWVYETSHYNVLLTGRKLPWHKHSKPLPDSVRLTQEIVNAVSSVDCVLLATPSQNTRAIVARMRESHSLATTQLVNLSKGIEIGSLARMSEVISHEIGVPVEHIVTLSGPSHAEEVLQEMPTTVVAASLDLARATRVQQLMSTDRFRVYCSDDIVGVELGGSLKNVIAIAAGIIRGLGMGDNTLGALITRGLAEMSRLGSRLGARESTFAGLSGLGDLVTTCVSEHSRNRHVGFRIGRGEKLEKILASMEEIAEGVQTTDSGFKLSEKYNVEMPITTEVYRVLFQNKSPASAISDLMGRTLKTEVWQ